MIKYIFKLFYKNEHDVIIAEINMRLWVRKTPIYRFFVIYVMSYILAIYDLFKYKFDYDKIDGYLMLKHRETKRRLRDATDKKWQLNLELKELEREMSKKEDQLKLFYLMEKQRLIDHVKSLKETNKS